MVTRDELYSSIGNIPTPNSSGGFAGAQGGFAGMQGGFGSSNQPSQSFNFEEALARFSENRPRIQPSGGGGGGGLVMKALGLLAIPHSIITSTVQETIDLFQGEGFSGSDWMQQIKDRRGFGDILAEENIDLGLGGWGNRIVGFVGDVALDPFTYMGGLGVYNRLRGARGLIDDVTPRLNELKNLGVRTADQTREMELLNRAVTTAGKDKSVSAVRNMLVREGDVGRRLAADLGIETGLRFRIPGTGPILGRMSRTGAFVNATSRARARQIPEYIRRNINKELGDDKMFTDLVARAARGRSIRQVGDQVVDESIQQTARRAARLPIEIVIKSPTGTPVLGSFFGRMQALPGANINRIAASRFGQAVGSKLGSTESNAIASAMRSGNPEAVMLGVFARNGFNRGSAMQGLFVSESEKALKAFQNNVKQNLGIVDDEFLGQVTNIVDLEQAAAIRAGTLPAVNEANLRSLFPNVSLENLAAIRFAYETQIRKVSLNLLQRPELYGMDQAFAERVARILLAEGGYTPHVLTDAAIGGANSGRELLELVYKSFGDGVEHAPRWMRNFLEQGSRPQSRHLNNRDWLPDFVDAEKGTYNSGSNLAVPKKGMTEEDLFLKNADGSWRVYETGPRVGQRVQNTDSWEYLTLKRQMEQVVEPGVVQKSAYTLRSHPQGWSTTQQIDDLFRRAGWIGDEDSLFTKSLINRETGYIKSMGNDVKWRAMETYAARQGILFSFDDVRSYHNGLKRVAEEMEFLKSQWSKLDDEQKGKYDALAAVLGAENVVNRSVTVNNLLRWIQKNEAAISALSGEDERLGLLLREVIETSAELPQLADEIVDLVDELSVAMGRAGLTDPDAAVGGMLLDELGLDVALPSPRKAIDAVRVLEPIIKDLRPLVARANLLDEAVARLRNVVEVVDNKEVHDIFISYAEQLGDDLDFIQNVLLPQMDNLVSDAMNQDRTVQAIEALRAVLSDGANLDDLAWIDPNVLKGSMKTFIEQIDEFRSLERIVSHERYRTLPQSVEQIMEEVQPVLNQLRREVGSPAPTARGAVDFESLLYELPPNASTNDIRELLESVTRGEFALGEGRDLVNISQMINNYDSLAPQVRIRLNRATLSQIVSDFEKRFARQASQLVEKERVLRTNRQRLTVKQQQAEQLEIEILGMELQKTQFEMEMLMRSDLERPLIEGVQDVFSNAGRYNFDSGIDTSNVTVKMLEDIFSEAKRMWGPVFDPEDPLASVGWRIAGDEAFAEQFTTIMLAAQKMADPREIGAFLRQYDRTLNWLKAQMVATPGFVLRNIMGGMFNMWVDDIPLTETIRTARLMQRAYRKGDGDLREGIRILRKDAPDNFDLEAAEQLLDAGAHAGGQAASAVEDTFRLDKKFQWVFGTKGGDTQGWRVKLNPVDAGFFMYSGVRHVNTFAEEMLRLGTGIHAMRTGGSLDDAIARIYRLHFNYSNLSDAESRWMKRLIPFYTWSRNNLPLQVSQMALNPRRYNRLLMIKRNLEYGTEEEGVVPDYFMKPFGIRLPFSIGGSQVYTVPDLPFQDLLRFDPTQEGFGDAVGHIISSGSPIFKTPIEYWAGKQMFKGIPYSGRLQQVPEPWGRIPGLMHALSTVGWAEKNARGEWKMLDSRIAMLDNAMPFLGRFRRLAPTEDRYQERISQTFASTFGGLSLRINTPYEQNAVRIREEMEKIREQQRARDLQFRTR